jgi:hypothetical protein
LPSASKNNTLVWPTVDADDISAPRRADHGVGDLGIGDQHVLDVARKIDDHRFADAEREGARAEIACGDRDRLRLRVIRQLGRAGGTRQAPDAPDTRQPETSEQPARAAARIGVLGAMVNSLRAGQCVVDCVLTP